LGLILTHCYNLYDDKKELKIMKPYPPLGLLYISTFLEEKGINNQIYDSTFYTKKEQYDYIKKICPKYLGIYVNLMTKLNVLELIYFIRNEGLLKDTIIILGGPDVRYNAYNLLKAGADYIVIGEGEVTTYELLKNLELNKKLNIQNIKGLEYLSESGELVSTGERDKIKDLDILPTPNRNKIKLEKYFNVWQKHHGNNSITISTMRGCPYTCKWCSRAVYGLSYRRLSPKRTIDEIQQIKNNYAPDSFWFVDDVFTISHKWFKEFTELLTKNNIKIRYECITRADRMNEEIITLLKESGCFRVWIGAESGSQKIIDLMDRRVDVKNVEKMIKLSKQNGIETGTFIMLGYPGETEEDINKTIKYLNDSNPDYFTITIAYPIRGTELFSEVENIQLKNYIWDITTDREIDFKRTYSKKYYKYAVSRVVNEVNYLKLKNNGVVNLSSVKMKIKSIISRFGMLWERKTSNVIIN